MRVIFKAHLFKLVSFITEGLCSGLNFLRVLFKRHQRGSQLVSFV